MADAVLARLVELAESPGAVERLHLVTAFAETEGFTSLSAVSQARGREEAGSTGREDDPRGKNTNVPKRAKRAMGALSRRV